MIRRDLAANACTTLQVGRARAAKFRDRKQSDSYIGVYACAPLSVSVTTQNGGRSLEVLRGLVVLIAAPNNGRRSFFFRFQEAERPTGGHPKIALDPLCFKDATLCLFSHLNLVLNGFAHHKSDLGCMVEFWLRALEHCRRSCTPSTSGTRLKVETPDPDPQRNCLD